MSIFMHPKRGRETHNYMVQMKEIFLLFRALLR